MNNPSPFSPQQPLLEQKNKSRRRVFMIGSVIVAANVVLLMTLLMIGCRKPADSEPAVEPTNTIAPFEPDTNVPPPFVPTNVPAMDTNVPAYVPPPVIETNTPAMIATPPAAGQDYQIVKGDTFDGLSKKFGVKTSAIQAANPGVDPRKLRVGQTIHIPAPTVEATTAPAGVNSGTTGTTASSGEQTYKVKSGDTLTGIARHHNVTVKALRSANNLTSDRIIVGQTLKIPAKPATTTAPATGM